MMSSEMMKWPHLPMISSFKDEMNKLFDSFGKRGTSAMSWSPLLDVSETDENIIVKAEVPGMDPKEIDVSINEDTLTIKGEKKSDKEEKNKNYHYMERSYGSFSRSITLPTAVQFDKTDAEYKNGILTITLPKVEKKELKKIPIKTD